MSIVSMIRDSSAPRLSPWPTGCTAAEAKAWGLALAACDEIERLRDALSEIALDTSLSVPLGASVLDHFESNTKRCIRIAATALAELEA